MGYAQMVYKTTSKKTVQNEEELVIGQMKAGEKQAQSVPWRVKLGFIIVLRSFFPQTAPIVGGIFFYIWNNEEKA